MYYSCSSCGKKFKYATDLIPVVGENFGRCPLCGSAGVFEKEGARTHDDLDYDEVDE